MTANINQQEAGGILLQGKIQKLTTQEIINLAKNSEFIGKAHKPTIVRLVKKYAENMEKDQQREQEARKNAERKEALRKEALPIEMREAEEQWLREYNAAKAEISHLSGDAKRRKKHKIRRSLDAKYNLKNGIAR